MTSLSKINIYTGRERGESEIKIRPRSTVVRSGDIVLTGVYSYITCILAILLLRDKTIT
jgi:hypothetical protein